MLYFVFEKVWEQHEDFDFGFVYKKQIGFFLIAHIFSSELGTKKLWFRVL